MEAMFECVGRAEWWAPVAAGRRLRVRRDRQCANNALPGIGGASPVVGTRGGGSTWRGRGGCSVGWSTQLTRLRSHRCSPFSPPPTTSSSRRTSASR